MVRASRSRVGLSAVDEALTLAGPVSWTRRLFGTGLRTVAARRYARIVLDEWHGARAAASLANHPALWDRSTRLTFVQGAELHAVGRTPEGKLAIATANIAGDIENAAVLPRSEVARQVRAIVRTASEIHALRTHAGQPVESRLVALATQVKRLGAIRDRG